MLENNSKYPIRILHYGLTNNLGGIEVFVMSLYKHIDRTKIQFDFISHEGIYFENEIKKRMVKFIISQKEERTFLNIKNS